VDDAIGTALEGAVSFVEPAGVTENKHSTDFVF
jgi:hypothetical protein